MNIHLVGALTGLISAFRYKAEEYNACLPQQIKATTNSSNCKYNAFYCYYFLFHFDLFITFANNKHIDLY